MNRIDDGAGFEGGLVVQGGVVRKVRDLVKSVVRNPPPEGLFGGDSDLFKEAASSSSVYGEYGCGESTLWVAENTSASIRSVDSSAFWIEHVQRQLWRTENIEISHAFVGELGDWGRPLNYEYRRNFASYIYKPWAGTEQPDLVLVDGRFRVACFLMSLMKGAVGTIILFDDYTWRPHYHLVEEFVAPSEFCGRQAMFRVPEILNREAIEAELERFIYVMD